jgi:hypothetical protein
MNFHSKGTPESPQGMRLSLGPPPNVDGIVVGMYGVAGSFPTLVPIGKPLRLAALVGLGLSLITGAAGGDPPQLPKARPLLPLAGPKAQVDAWKVQLCARPEVGCAKAAELALYRVAGDPPAVVWGILATAPVLLKLSHGNASDWGVVRRWDFSSYTQSRAPDDPTNDPISVYPALYPAGPGSWAVALVSDAHEYYSGGWATFSVADFVVLRDAPDAGIAKALYSGVMFSCLKAIRACFTEEDYRRRGNHCHDEFRGYLSLRYAPTATAGVYPWTAVWNDSDGSAQTVPLQVGGNTYCHFATFDVCDGNLDGLDANDCANKN